MHGACCRVQGARSGVDNLDGSGTDASSPPVIIDVVYISIDFSAENFVFLR